MMDAIATATAIASGERTEAEVLADTLDRIATQDPRIHAIAGLDGPAEATRGRPLSGVPTLVKDLLPMAGRPCTFGSRLFRGFVAPANSPYADAIATSGLRVIGRTTSSELGLLGSTESLANGVTRNPWDLARSAAGSSGGAAAAVAAGMVPIAHASDGGGSIRIPASVTGTFGFKPSRGRCLRALPPAPVELVIDHCITRTVRDSAAFLAATEDPRHPTPIGFVAGPSPRRLRIGVHRRTVFGEAADPRVDAVLDRAADHLRRLGHTVVEIDGPTVDAAAISAAFFLFAGFGVAAAAGQAAPFLGRPPGPDELEPFSLVLMERALRAGPAALADAVAAIEAAGAAWTRWAEAYDATLSPTIPDLPPLLGHLAPTLDPDLLIARTNRLAGYTAVVTMAGAPAMSVPIGAAEGLPVGVQLAALPGDDALLLGLAYELEAAGPWGGIVGEAARSG